MIHLLGSISPGDTGSPHVPLDQVFQDIIKALLSIAGSLSVIFIIIGGLKYVTSAGDPQKLSSAKQTITFAIVGLVISALAFTIMAFVVKTITV